MMMMMMMMMIDDDDSVQFRPLQLVERASLVAHLVMQSDAQ